MREHREQAREIFRFDVELAAQEQIAERGELHDVLMEIQPLGLFSKLLRAFLKPRGNGRDLREIDATIAFDAAGEAAEASGLLRREARAVALPDGVPATMDATHDRVLRRTATALMEGPPLACAAKAGGEIIAILPAPESHFNEAALTRIARDELPHLDDTPARFERGLQAAKGACHALMRTTSSART